MVLDDVLSALKTDTAPLPTEVCLKFNSCRFGKPIVSKIVASLLSDVDVMIFPKLMAFKPRRIACGSSNMEHKDLSQQF